MKFVLAAYGTRGDIEPSLAAGRELQGRGHEVRLAVPPNLVDLAGKVGLTAVPYGPPPHDFWDDELLLKFSKFYRNFWTIREPIRLAREAWEPVLRHWADMSKTLTALTDGADLLFTGQLYQDLAVNVGEYYDIPLAVLHYFPMRPNGHLVPYVPAPLARTGFKAYDWMCWRMNKKAEDAQRRELGLPMATGASPRRIAERGSLEIQAYDEAVFPGLAREWRKWNGQRPFVGALTMGLTTDRDDEISSWVASGSPPICFGFGSMPVESPAETVKMISNVCTQLGERALVCSGWTDFTGVPEYDHVMVVGAANYERVFPACRAIVHHGGSGTTAASLRAGVPTMILWTAGDQPFFANQLKRLKVGAGRRFSSTTPETLVADLRRILTREYAANARDLGARMTKPSESVGRTADLLENFARTRCLT
jgi:UDP:flavonoid glycosyltransferase YjiC (YdhE family)